ncbi:MAG: S8 family peptidase [bacterium]
MITRTQVKDLRYYLLIFLLSTIILFSLLIIRINFSHAYFSPYPAFFQPPWQQIPYFSPVFPGSVIPPQYPYSNLYPRFARSNTNYPASFYPNFGGFGFLPYRSYNSAYSLPLTSQLPFYTPANPASMYTLFNNPGLASAYLRPDPQWRIGKEVTPSPPPTPGMGTGIETGQLRIGATASQRRGTNSSIVPSYVNRQLIVMFRPEVPPQERMAVLGKHNCTEIRTSAYGGFTLIALSSFQSVRDTAEQFSMEPSVLYAEPNYYRRAHLLPNDPYYVYQWHFPWPHLATPLSWDINTGAGVTVGLLDSGVAYRTAAPYAQAPDLAGTLFAPGWDFVNADAFPDDDYGHGTHMCGCIAQTTNNLLGVAGVAFSSTIMPVKVMDSLGDATIADEADGIYFATNNGARVINMSFGGVGTSATEEAALVFAYSQGVTQLGSSGNAGSTVPEYPAAYPECISVGAVQYDQTRAPYSNYGVELDLVAPGGNITLDQNFDGYGDGILQQRHDGVNFTSFYYEFMEGTSPACALAAGVTALVISKSTAVLTPLQVTNILQTTATDLGVVGWDQEYGWGEVYAYGALLNTP